jgi:hypothetical protein
VRHIPAPDKDHHRRQNILPAYWLSFCNFCGLWLGQALFEQRSGMVFVPSIISDWHMGQILPVGLALMAFLQLG